MEKVVLQLSQVAKVDAKMVGTVWVVTVFARVDGQGRLVRSERVGRMINAVGTALATKSQPLAIVTLRTPDQLVPPRIALQGQLLYAVVMGIVSLESKCFSINICFILCIQYLTYLTHSPGVFVIVMGLTVSREMIVGG